MPDVPKSLDIKIKREKFIVDKMLEGDDVDDNIDKVSVRQRKISEGAPTLINGNVGMDDPRYCKSF